ncbi:MAG TPA: hypothetical protein VD735_07255, partial [Candidatus Saccharimonadales bacterium]|nr:hypothetical protein [Candidatus Saccharimonadales bacterium]
MAPRVPINPELFRKDFDTMFDAARQPDVAWYNEPLVWPEGRTPYEVWQITNPLDVPFHEESWRYQDFVFNAWPVAYPEQAQLVTQKTDIHAKPNIRKGPFGGGGQVYRLAPRQTVAAFAKHAPDGKSLVHVSDALVAHINAGGEEDQHPATQFMPMIRAVGHLVGRSLLLGPGPDGAYGSSETGAVSLPESLAVLRPGNERDRVSRYVSRSLTTVLLRDEADTYKIGSLTKAMHTTERWFVMHAVAAMQDEGIVTPDFWWRNCMETGMVFDKDVGDTALAGLEAALMVDGEAVLVDVPAERLQSIMRAYVSKILTTYASDPNRNTAALHKIIDVLATQRSKRLGSGIIDMVTEMRPLISLSNGLAQGLNKRLQSAGVTDPVLQLPMLDHNLLWNVPPALLRVLYATVRPDADPEAQAVMFERDNMHVSVL